LTSGILLNSPSVRILEGSAAPGVGVEKTDGLPDREEVERSLREL